MKEQFSGNSFEVQKSNETEDYFFEGKICMEENWRKFLKFQLILMESLFDILFVWTSQGQFLIFCLFGPIKDTK